MPQIPDDPYYIWSHEHAGWWGPHSSGYVRRLSEAGIYSRDEAIAVCARAIPGTAARMGALPEIPVRAADLAGMMNTYYAALGEVRDEPWM